MKFISDLHIHSKYSRATAKNLDLENIWIAAQLKGITVVGTGDFTHPAWFAEIKEKLEPAEPGLYKLKESIAHDCEKAVPSACRGRIRFMLVSEISNIYKKNGKTRKNHNLVFAPSFEVVENINRRLDAIGNIHSDGRPILGLDARHLLEIILEQSSDTFLIPAHIWTPWFSVLGSKSGFDTIDECFEDLAGHIFALETGLSSDPPMNWRVSALDRYSLVSNSDAHSPMKLGREANLFDTELSYFAIRSALESHDSKRFLGTFEFYPEEGKYHADGHRKCQVCLQPSETLALNNLCPVCGKQLTLGVLYRVAQLADRRNGEKPAHAGAYYNLIPLEQILSEILQVGPGSKKVQSNYHQLLNRFGSEFDILHHFELDTLSSSGIPLLKEAIQRMRENQINFSPGYDGEYGKLAIFSVEERESLLSQRRLFKFCPSGSGAENKEKNRTFKNVEPKSNKCAQRTIRPDKSKKIVENEKKVENDEQREAIRHTEGPLLIVAGPGTGKTFTLTQRIFQLIDKKMVKPDEILAVTFTRKAAMEMRGRICAILNNASALPLITTFHGLCWELIQENSSPEAPLAIIDPADRLLVIRDAMVQAQAQGCELTLSENDFLNGIVAAKQAILLPDEIAQKAVPGSCSELAPVYAGYQQILKLQGLLDYEDVILQIVKRLERDSVFLQACRRRFPYIFVDEYQDLNEGQYRIIRALAADPMSNICVIGDPDQAIYGFRGSDVTYFKRFKDDFPQAKVIRLSRNYRSTETILESSFQVIKKEHIAMSAGPVTRIYSGINGTQTISVMPAKSEQAEAVAIGRVIEQMVGGMGFHALDFDKLEKYQESSPRSFSDFAVLFRTHLQGEMIRDLLEKAGIPCQFASRENLLNTPEITALLKLLNLAEGKGTFVDLEYLGRTVKPGLPPKVISTFKSWAYQGGLPLSEAVNLAFRRNIDQMSSSGQQRLLTFLDLIKSWSRKIVDHPPSEKLEILARLPEILTLVKDHRSFQENLKKLVDRNTSFGLEPAKFVSVLALENDSDCYDDKVEKVALMTMHAAKGLEFPVVFIAGCEDELIPFKRVGNGQADLQEERRLFYVAMTRAKEMLFLSWASTREQRGRRLERKICPFIQNIERHLQEYVTTAAKKNHICKQTQLSLF